MTDNEIIKALECCGFEYGNPCSVCPKYEKDNDFCQEELHNYALDLINRQQAEIEKLQVFKSYFDELYGTGLDIANYHLNGALESFDNFYESALQEMVGENNA